MAVNLVFKRPQQSSPPYDLVFGEQDSGGGDINVVVRSRLSTLRVKAHASVQIPIHARVKTKFSTLKVKSRAHYDNAVWRGLSVPASSPWQKALRQSFLDRSPFQLTQRQHSGLKAPWAEGIGVEAQTSLTNTDSIPTPHTTSAVWDEAQHLEGCSTTIQSDSGIPVRQTLRAFWTDGVPVQHGTSMVWITLDTHARQQVHIVWNAAQSLEESILSPMGVADVLPVSMRIPWDETMQPLPGTSSIVPPEPPHPDPCYRPPRGDVTKLVFKGLRPRNNNLVFACRRDTPTIVIPDLWSYVVEHEMSLVRLPDGEPIEALQVNISTDADSWCWSFSATCQGDVMKMLTAAPGQPPVQIKVTLDGTEWIFVVETLRRSRQFGQDRVDIGGRSLTAALADPYAKQRDWLSDAMMTAQQLATKALEYTDVDLDWQADDWLVPAGAWSFTGTPMSAVLRIAESCGAIVRSARNESILRVIPRYPSMPWEWGQTSVGVQIPLSVALTDSFERQDRPDYNGVYVIGQVGGIIGQVVRAGTAGDLLAPQVVDPLITATEAARGRGMSILGDTGTQASVGLTMPLLPYAGVIDVGTMIEVVEPDETWRGLVRATSLAASLPTLRQFLTVERHL